LTTGIAKTTALSLWRTGGRLHTTGRGEKNGGSGVSDKEEALALRAGETGKPDGIAQVFARMERKHRRPR